MVDGSKHEKKHVGEIAREKSTWERAREKSTWERQHGKIAHGR
jgi:hypothetical protein